MTSAPATSQKDRAVALLKAHGPMRRVELGDAGIHPETLARMLQDRILIRITRGPYQLADAEVTTPSSRLRNLYLKESFASFPPFSSTTSRSRHRAASGSP